MNEQLTRIVTASLARALPMLAFALCVALGYGAARIATNWWVAFPLLALGLLMLPLRKRSKIAAAIYSYCRGVWTALDQLVNAFVFAGNPDETVSSHAGKIILAGRDNVSAWQWRWATWAKAITDPWAPGHVEASIEERESTPRVKGWSAEDVDERYKRRGD